MRAALRFAATATLAAAIALSSLLAAPEEARAQSDVQLWTSASLRYRPARRVRIELEQNLRFDENISRLSSAMPGISVSYDPVRALRLGVGYRFIWERGDSSFGSAHRLHADARVRGDVGRVSFSYRLRFQEKLVGEDGDGDGLETRHTLRNRVGLAVDTDSLVTPTLSAELYTRVGHGEGATLRKWRLTMGVDLDLDDHRVNLFYRVEASIEDEQDPTLHILGIGYRFDLPRPGR